MHRSRMMKRTLAFFQLHRHRLESLFQIFGQTFANAVHFPGQHRFRKIRPLMTSGNVIQTAVFARGIVQANPAGEVRQRRGSRPVRIILVPRHNPAMPRGLAEKLVVPEAHWSAQQLGCRHQKRQIPKQIVKTRQCAPSAQRMNCLLYTSPSPRDLSTSRMPSSA